MKMYAAKRRGFTIVELLIVIVVIAILASITVVAYNGIQQRARDSDRMSGVATITKALEFYYVENGAYPSSTSCNSSTINHAWCTTADSSWTTFETRLTNQFITKVPRDPISTPNMSPLSGSGYNFAYFSHNVERCGSIAGQWYLFVYVKEGAAQQDDRDCSTGTSLSSYSYASEQLRLR